MARITEFQHSHPRDIVRRIEKKVSDEISKRALATPETRKTKFNSEEPTKLTPLNELAGNLEFSQEKLKPQEPQSSENANNFQQYLTLFIILAAILALGLLRYYFGIR